MVSHNGYGGYGVRYAVSEYSNGECFEEKRSMEVENASGRLQYNNIRHAECWLAGRSIFEESKGKSSVKMSLPSYFKQFEFYSEFLENSDFGDKLLRGSEILAPLARNHAPDIEGVNVLYALFFVSKVLPAFAHV